MFEDSVYNPIQPCGEYKDVLINPQGAIVWQSDWRENLIVDGARRLIAALLKGDLDAHALSHLAIGTGEKEWVSEPPPKAVQQTFTQLANEIQRKNIEKAGSMTFLDSDNKVTTALTNRLEITVSFTNENDRQMPIPLREFGVFAGGTDDVSNSGVLVNHVIHDTFYFEKGFTLMRTLRLKF